MPEDRRGQPGKRMRILRLTIATSLALLLVIILKYASNGSNWHYVAFLLSIVGGLYWVSAWVWEFHSEARKEGITRRYSLFYVLFYILFVYIGFVVIFAAGYIAASNLGGQVLCVKDNYQCVRGFCVLVYYSLVTASTLGYGDLVPVGIARLLVCIEVPAFWIFLGGGFLCLRRAARSPAGRRGQ